MTVQKSSGQPRIARLLLVAGVAFVPVLMIGCNIIFPPGGPTTLSGVVTSATTGQPIAGATVTLDPAVDGVAPTTAEDGSYTAEIDAGEYTVTFAADNYESVTETATLVDGQTTNLDITMTPSVAAVVTVETEGDAQPGNDLTAKAMVNILDGTTTVESYTWTIESVAGAVVTENGDEATIALPDAMNFKQALIHVLSEPPLDEEQLPPNVPVPDEDTDSGLQDRFQIIGIDPFSLEEAAHVVVTVTVVTSSGEFTGSAEVAASLPWSSAAGIRNVPIGKSVLLYGKAQESYDWTMEAPASSAATLDDANTQYPEFIPDVEGVYTVTVTNTTNEEEAVETIEIYAGPWVGTISGKDENGLPKSDACTVCHNGGIADDQFTPWAATGHAAIFTDSINTSDHYAEHCLVCHTVGYDEEVDNGGFDDAADYEDFLATGMLHSASEDNWDTVVSDFPATAQLANIQCENCHGPQGGDAHTDTEARTDISSSVCAVCHGEPLRHARFQQWQLSKHGNYQLAGEEGMIPSCVKCHTGNGFIAWLKIVNDDDPETDASTSPEVTWTADGIHPVTCVVCHDPHDVGTTTDVETNATMRIYGDTPELDAGFTVTDAGNGAICMACHNSRRGLRNDDTWEDTKTAGELARAPHAAAQTDVLEGMNAYFVEVGTAGSHAAIEDTCVKCHMEETPPPDLLAYNLGGTNHTFYAEEGVCTDCHAFGIEVVTAGVEEDMAELKALIEVGITEVITEQLAAGNTIDIAGEATITSIDDIGSLEFTDSHGNQGIAVTLADGTVLEAHSLGDVMVMAGNEELGALYSFANDDLPKAGWNYLLVHNDGSRGTHNPSFVSSALQGAIDALSE